MWVPPEIALQDTWPEATCYGCGPANNRGLHIKSYWIESEQVTVCTFQPEAHHNAGFPDVLYGGLVASLCDCHSVWAAIAATYRAENRPHGSDPAISYVTGNLNVSFLAPTPLSRPIVLRAVVEEIAPRKAIITCGVYAGEQKTAESRLVAVRIAADKSVGFKEGRG